MLGRAERRLSALPVVGAPLESSRVLGRGSSAAEPCVADKSRAVYRFEDVEINCSQGVLKRDGYEQYVRQQSFRVLLYVLEHRHRLVSKEELIENFGSTRRYG
jgi:DNA-binding response OmpR family regulator